MNKVLENLGIDYLLVNSTNEYLVEYSDLRENARYTLTGFSGSTGDALLTKDGIFLFVDGRYHAQADMEVYEGVTVVKLQLGQSQDEEIRKLLSNDKILGIVSKKVSQKRLEGFDGYKVKLLDVDPINNFTVRHSEYSKVVEPVDYEPLQAEFITNLEEVSYLTGLRDFSSDYSSKVYAKLFIKGKERLLFKDDCRDFLVSYKGDLVVDKSSINAYDYSCISNPVSRESAIKKLKAVKTDEEIGNYKRAFEKTDKALMAVRDYIINNDNLSEYDIVSRLRAEFIKYGAKSLSFKPIVAIDKNSALAHYSKSSKEILLKEGSLVLIDCGAYYDGGYATDITRVFVKGEPTDLQKRVYTTVLKAFLNAYKSLAKTGIELDTVAHNILDNSVEGFSFSHGLGHGIGINVHEAPPALNQSAIGYSEILDNMCYTIEPGLYNPEYFGVRLENSCYRNHGKNRSFVKMGYEGKLIDLSMLSDEERLWLEEFEIL